MGSWKRRSKDGGLSARQVVVLAGVWFLLSLLLPDLRGCGGEAAPAAARAQEPPAAEQVLITSH